MNNYDYINHYYDIISFEELSNELELTIRDVYNRYASDFEYEDVKQEMLMELWNSLRTFEGKSKFTTYVTSVFKNVCLKHVRDNTKKIQTINLLGQDGEERFTIHPQDDFTIEEMIECLESEKLKEYLVDGMATKWNVEFLTKKYNITDRTHRRWKNKIREQLGNKLE